MNVYILMYDECALYEVILACYFLKTKYNITTVGIDRNEVKVFEGINVKCDKGINDIKIFKDDIVIIPGGDINLITNKLLLKKVLFEANKVEAMFGAICAGVDISKESGLIDSNDVKRYSVDSVKLGDRFIFAKPNEYVDFAIGLGTVANIYRDKDDFNETVSFFKYFNRC